MRASGIENLLVEAQVCLRGAADKIMSGKDYYAVLHAHGLVHTAMFQLHWEVFKNRLATEEKGLETMSLLASKVEPMLEALSTNDPLHVTAVCSDATASLIEALELLDEYDGTITAPTARLWIMYMDMVMIMKRFIHAERAGLWDEHLAEMEKMMPYLVAAGMCLAFLIAWTP